MLEGPGIHLVLAHATRLKGVAVSNYGRDEIDAGLLARMRLAGLIQELHPKYTEQMLAGRPTGSELEEKKAEVAANTQQGVGNKQRTEGADGVAGRGPQQTKWTQGMGFQNEGPKTLPRA